MDILPHEKPIQEYIKTIEHLKKQSLDNPIFNEEIRKLESEYTKQKEFAILNAKYLKFPWTKPNPKSCCCLVM